MRLLYVAKAKIIQRCWLRYKARKRYRNYKKTIIYLQSCVRRMIARRQLKQLKVRLLCRYFANQTLALRYLKVCFHADVDL